MDVKGKEGDQWEYCDQICREEIKMHYFFTNIVFFFAGISTVNMSHQLTELLWVVLALCAHSLEGGGKMACTSM